MIRVGAVDQDQALHPEGARRDLDLFAVAGQFIGALPVDLDRRELGRDLHDVADKGLKRLDDPGILGAQVAGCDYLAVGVVGVRCLPEPDGELIGFERVGDVGHGFRGLAQRHRQHAGRLGVEGSGMANFFYSRDFSDLIDHIMRRWTFWFINRKNSLHNFSPART